MTKRRGDIIEHGPSPKGTTSKKPAWLQKRLDWFMDQRFGMIVHWGPYSQWDCCESWPLVPADTWARPDTIRCWTERGKDLDRFTRDYWNLNRTFNPTRFDPDAWAEIAQAAGMRYVTFTTKHHDGFCMFDTATTDYRITHPSCPFHKNRRANIAKEVFDAFRRHGMAISCYFSKSDWHSPYYWAPDWPVRDRHPNYDTAKKPERWARFVDFVHRQVEELMTQYGAIDVLWLDGGQVRPPDQDIQMAKLAAMARTHQPGLIMADRTVGGDYEDIITPEQQIPEEPLSVPWESCITLGHHWKFTEDDQFKSASEIIRMLIETAAKGGNLLLGVGPDPTGLIPAPAAERLREIGDWLRTYGEAIYGTRPIPPYQSGSVRFTKKGRHVYAFIMKEKGDAPSRVVVKGLCPKARSKVVWMKNSTPVAWKAEADGFAVDVPQDPSSIIPVVVLKLEMSSR